MSFSKEIKKGAIISYFAILFNIIIGLLYTPWMVNKIGVSDYGLYTLIIAFLTYIFIDFGLAQSVAKFISQFKVDNRKDEINKLISIIFKIYIYIDIFIVIILLISFFNLSEIFQKLTEVEILKFRKIFIIAGLFSVVSFPLSPLNGIFLAFEKFYILKLFDLIQKITIIILIIFALNYGYGLYALVTINSVVGFLIKILLFYYIKRKEKLKLNLYYHDNRLLKDIFSFSFWIFLITIAQRLILNITPTILGIFSGTSEIAFFAIGMTIEGYSWTIASAFSGFFLPRVTRLVKSEKNEEILILMITVGRIQLVICGFLISCIFIFGKAFISLWMGQLFTKSYVIAILLLSPGIVIFTQEIANTLMYVSNNIKFRGIVYIASGIFSLILSFYLTPIYGAIGSSFAIFISLIVFQVIIMNVFYYKKLNLDIIVFFKSVHLKIIFPIILLAIIFSFIQIFVSISSWYILILILIIYSLLYLIIMWKFVFNNFEKNLLKSLLKLNKSN